MAFLKQRSAPIPRRRATAAPGFFLALVLWGWLGGAEARGQTRDVEIKAAFLYHFTQFVEWPTNAFAEADSPLVIGVLGSDPFGETLNVLVAGERIRGRPLQVRRFSTPEEARGVHILYIGVSEEDEWNSIQARLGARPILTVSEMNNFARRGGMIQYYTDENRIKLRINHRNARESGLVLSSKLLRVAEVIDSD